ncbi:carbohydrate ABC transporter permease [Paenibacillus donghaensis]|uniref:carbohydrate ABC transporter permease n=1 Tax=Paenibacillus donghaensis TaxID=414771 RepID=UPI0018847B04|nr:carbohydrate ABC transporter permease [Paenibacillus donghaensis]MBE9918095.1 carbohydrate ABC transporter permease [Paenibacillus donghaensis]
MYYKSRSYKLFYAVNFAILLAASLACILPLVHILAVSFSAKEPANANLVGLWPIGFNTDAYAQTFSNTNFLRSMLVSVERVVLGTGIGMLVTVLTAYPLSKINTRFRGRAAYTWFFVFTMLFNGGLIPTYIVVQRLHLMNSIWALVLPGVVSAWNIVLLLNFFKTVPRELEEASLIDGANHFKTLLYIYVPISMPSLATLSLFTMVAHWNSWFDGMIYLTETKKWPLSTLLQTIVVTEDFSKINLQPEDVKLISNQTVKASQIFIGAIPILLVYPFLQKYFVKGMVLGAVKE